MASHDTPDPPDRYRRAEIVPTEVISPDVIPADPEVIRQLAATPVERFSAWERRGRGWDLWDAHAWLEPPFRPFFHLPTMTFAGPHDDGRRHTALSRMAEKADRWWKGEREPERDEPEIPDWVIPLLAEPDLPPYADRDAIVELQILPPGPGQASGGNFTFDSFSSFLLSLAFCQGPLSFEIIGTADAVVTQLACRERDERQVREQLAAHFPEVRVAAAPRYLGGHWTRDLADPAVVVEFGLANEFMLPLRCLPSASDPLVGVVGALAGLAQGEVGLLQVMFESVRMPWAESIFRAVTDDEGRAFFGNAPEMVGLAKQKIRSPLFGAVIRVAARCEDHERSLDLAQHIAAPLSYLTHPTVNELIPLDNEGYDPVEHEVDVGLRLSHRGGMILNAEELVSLVHIPTAAVRSEKFVRRTGRTRAAPKEVLGHDLALGENEHEDEIRTVTLSPDQRSRHMHVIGAPGTGKSTFLLNLIVQDMERGEGVAVMDPHADLIDAVLARVPDERLGDVILFDPSDSEYPVGFNILSARTETEKQMLSSDLVGIFRRLSTSWGDQMTSVLGNAILAFLESDRGGTLANLRRFLVEKEYREDYLASVGDPEVTYYWRKEFPMLTGGRSLGPLLTRLDTFLRPRPIRHMVAQRDSRLDFARIMDGGRIFLARLSHGAVGAENAWLLGSLLVSKFHQIALARQEQREAERRPFTLVIDEFHNFVTPSMAEILAGARKYRLGLVLAHQETGQLGGKSSEIAGSVLANPFTRVCFRLGDDDARKLASGFAHFEADDLQNLDRGEAVCRAGRAGDDFNLRTSPAPPVSEAQGRERAEKIRELSRERYAARREEVEAELAADRAGADAKGGSASADGGSRRRKAEAVAGGGENQRADLSPGGGEEADAPVSESHEHSGGAVEEVKAAGETVADMSVAAARSAGEPISFEEAIERRDREKSASETGGKETDPPKASSVITPPPPPAPLGRGGPEHVALQRRIRLWARGMGWTAEIEKPVLGGAGSVDVELARGGLAVACEISVTTGAGQELSNIEKCLRAGYERVAVVSGDPKHLSSLRGGIEPRLSADAEANVRFLTPEELFAWLETLEADAAGKEGVTKGRKVKVRFKPLDADARDERTRSIAGAVADVERSGEQA